MKKFLLHTVYFILCTSLLLEFGSRVLVDQVYYYAIDPYRSPAALTDSRISEIWEDWPDHVDYLFIGSSRVAAAIDPKQWSSQMKSENVSINAGRGFITGGTHYLALQHILTDEPEYLKGAKVFLELPGGAVYTEHYTEHVYDFYPAMPHLILPHINNDQFWEILKRQSTFEEKAHLFALYWSSFYRTYPFFVEYKSRFTDRLVRPESNNTADLKNVGGIKVDSLAVADAKERALRLTQKKIEAQSDQPALTADVLERSILAKLEALISAAGGELVLFEIPMHRTFARIYETESAMANKEVFRNWAENKGIKIMDAANFSIGDEDFPDYWHMSTSKRTEFTSFMANNFSRIY